MTHPITRYSLQIQLSDTPRIRTTGIRTSGLFQDVTSPYSGEVLAQVEQADEAAIESGISLAVETFEKVMKKMPPYRRAEILENLASQMKARHEELSLTIAREGGKPLTDARIEVSRAINTVRLSAHEAVQLDGEQQAMGTTDGNENKLSFTIREPIGVVSCISAFNHPVNLIAHQVAPPIAAGNTVLLKPSGDTPISALKMGEMLQNAGLPDGVLTILPCDRSVAEKLAVDERVNYLSFIGSARVGWHLRRSVADGTRVGLEHGGNAPAIIEPDADLETVAKICLKGGYYHAGQVCVSVQRLYLHHSIFERFVEMFKPMVESLVVGDPTSPLTDVGPLIRPREVERVSRWVQEAVEGGAEIITGGHPLDHNCYAPTLLTNASPGMDVVDNEIFGPVICLFSYDDLDQVIDAANAGPYGFQAAIFTKDIATAFHAARELNFTAVMINDSTAFRVDWMPFGGRYESGLGMGGVKYAIHEMTHPKLIVLNL